MLFFLGVEDCNATATYIKQMSPIITGIEDRIHFKNDVSEKSRAHSVYTQSSHLLLIIYSALLLLCHFISI